MSIMSSLPFHLIAFAQIYSAALAEGRCSFEAMSEREIREYDTEILRRPVTKRDGKDEATEREKE